MNKISYYGRRLNAPVYPYNYNYNHINYIGYVHPYKKNPFKNRQKLNNPAVKNIYIEERKKNNYYYNNSFNNFIEGGNGHHSIFQKRNHFHRYTSYFTEEKKIEEEINDSVKEEEKKEEEKKEEILKIRINISDDQYKEFILCKDDNIFEKVVEFCKDNYINEKLVQPLYNKVNQSLNTLEIINNNNLPLNKNDFLILNKVKNISDNNENN